MLDFDPPQPDAPDFRSQTSDLVYFLSWGYSARYGASHELSQAATMLRDELGIDIRPLLTFADRDVEDPADEDALERAWQDATPLADCCQAISKALVQDKRFEALGRAYTSLKNNVEELGRIARWAAEHSTRIRVTYVLDNEP